MREREKFETWWRGSKYMQVVTSSKGREQTAWDGWQAACSQRVWQEPIYQLKLATGDWRDQAESSYRNNLKHFPADVRIVYAAHGAQAECAASDASAQPVAEVIKWKTFTGHTAWDFKVFDKTIEHGTKLYARPASSDAQAECGKSSGEALEPGMIASAKTIVAVADAHKVLEFAGDRVTLHVRYAIKCLMDELGQARSAAPQHIADIDAMRELKRIANELRNYNPGADEYVGEHVHKYWARDIESAIAQAVQEPK